MTAYAAEPVPRLPNDDHRLEVVRAFATNVLEKGLDRWSGKETALLADGVNVDTGEPVEWVFKEERWIVSNLASQQNLFRTLVGLTALTDDARFRSAAVAATRYHLDHLRRPCGLLQWGGHRFVDLRTLRIVGEQDQHEFKSSYPYYDLLHEIDPEAATHFIRALWNAHILDWKNLDMNRHGIYNRPMGKLWANDFAGAEPFFYGKGLTFINCGSDLIYAGGQLYAWTGEPGALTWATRLAEQYVRARDPKTELGAYQFSQAIREREPTDDRQTWSVFGDRAKRQLGPEFGDRALEGRVLDPGRATIIYGRATIAQLRLAELLGEDGATLRDWARSGLAAYARHAYDPRTNLRAALFTDGTPLTPADIKRPGYYRPEVFEPQPAQLIFFLSYALGHRLTGDLTLWETARAVARAHQLGDLGERPGIGIEPDLETACADPMALFGLLEIMRQSSDPAYLALARRLADNIVAQRFHHGYFLPSAQHLNACFDALEPLALLTLEAHLRGTPDVVPVYPGGRGYIHGPHDGHGRTYDSHAIWAVTRPTTP